MTALFLSRLALMAVVAVSTCQAFLAPHSHMIPNIQKNKQQGITTPLLRSSPWSSNTNADDTDDSSAPFATRTTRTTTPNSASSISSSGTNFDLDLSGITAKLQETLQSLNLDSLTDSVKNVDFNAIKENMMSGNLGERGEAYFAAQLAVTLCVLGGGIPVIGDALMFLLGPGLLAAGLGVMVVALTGMGKSLSPWPVPPDTAQSDGLITDGMFAYIRHPSYAGLLAACAGLSIVTGSATRLLLTALLWYVLEVKSDYEETELTKVFPEYNQYKQQVTNKFVPQVLLEQLPWMTTNKK